MQETKDELEEFLEELLNTLSDEELDILTQQKEACAIA